VNLPAADPAPTSAGTPAALPAPPVPPGQLAIAPSAVAVREFLELLRRWLDDLSARLDRLDADAQLASDPDVYTPDIALAMTLRQSITTRSDEVVAVWDSGRVGPEQLARIAVLLWGRLTDPLGGTSAFTLTEAGTLAAALADRLAGALAADAVAGSGVAGRIAPLAAALVRCRSLAEVLGSPTDRIDAIDAQLQSVLASKDRARITAAVVELEPEVSGIERDLIKDTGLRTTTARLAASVRARYADLPGRADALAALVERARSRIAGLTDIPVPTVAPLDQPPAVPAEATAAVAQWRSARAELERYATALDEIDRGWAAVETHYGAPLRARDDLRGLLGAYATRAARSGLAEDPVVTDAYRAAHDMLWSAPCDLDVAERLVEQYQHAVRIGTGAAPAAEPTTGGPSGPSRDEGERR
jgi:hypothetical protein